VNARRLLLAAPRFIAVTGILVGAAGAAMYGLASQIWPTSIALVIALAAIELVSASVATDWRRAHLSPLYWVFVVLIKYNTLMALSTAHAPFEIPFSLTLGLIMIAGQAASYALVVSVMAHAPHQPRVSATDLALALIVGLAPATLLGIPGLIGLAAAIIMRLVVTMAILSKLNAEPRTNLAVTQQVTELCFYLGALATWKFI